MPSAGRGSLLPPHNREVPLASSDDRQPRPYLLFSLHGLRYAVEAQAVREIFWLPRLSPIEETPPSIVGAINFRGTIVPVMDLAIRFGHPPSRYHLTDVVIMLEWQGARMAVIVSEVQSVEEIAPAQVQKLTREQAAPARSHLVAGEIKLGDDVLMLLDVGRLVAVGEDGEAPRVGIQEATGPAHSSEVPSTIPPPFCPDAGPEELRVFQERAHKLSVPLEAGDGRDLLALALVVLAGERYAIPLEGVREFVTLSEVVPIPCCPPHIVGDMNLRGDLLTILDIRGLLHLPAGGDQTLGQAMVAQTGDVVIGVLVNEVVAVIVVGASTIQPVPAALQRDDEAWLAGMVLHEGETLPVLALTKVLSHDGLYVKGEV